MQMIMSAGWKQTTVTGTQIVLILSVVLLVNVKMALWGMALSVKVSQSMVISGPSRNTITSPNSHKIVERIWVGESKNVTPLSHHTLKSDSNAFKYSKCCGCPILISCKC